MLKDIPLAGDDFIVDMKRTSLANAMYQFREWYNDTHKITLPHLNLQGLRHTPADSLPFSFIDDGFLLTNYKRFVSFGETYSNGRA